MKIAIIGTGGVGGYYGALLAKEGHEVTFFARGEHLRTIQRNGLQIKSPFGDFNLFPAHATDDPAQIGPVELVLFCVKTYDTEVVAKRIQPILSSSTTVLSLQNGIDAVERIARFTAPHQIIAGATWISTSVEAPGVIKQVSQFRRIVIGELDGSLTPRIQAIYDAFKQTGVTVELSQEIQKILWTKFVFISTASSFGALTRLPLGDWRSLPETRLLVVSLMKEVEAVGRAHGANLDADIIEKTMAFIDSSSPHIKASMQVDVEAGKQFELESIVGAIGKKGRQVGIPTPIADLVYAVLLPVLKKAQK